jgi:hypothetical protein
MGAEWGLDRKPVRDPALERLGVGWKIQLWGRDIELPPIESVSFAISPRLAAIERAQLTEAGAFLNPASVNTKAKLRKNV